MSSAALQARGEPLAAEDGTVVVALPPALLHHNACGFVQAVSDALSPDILRVRLDAAALRSVDTAGLGALTRVFRLSIDALGSPPQLCGPGVELSSALQSLGLLGCFGVAAGFTNGSEGVAVTGNSRMIGASPAGAPRVEGSGSSPQAVPSTIRRD